jgi:hypothetical protein
VTRTSFQNATYAWNELLVLSKSEEFRESDAL